jgi:hypothetical protein
MTASTFRHWLGRARPPGFFVLWTLLFALAYAQSPLYTSNQNQYFLHGLAQVGFGFLRNDWLATTLDPTPVFSLLVGGTVRLLGPWAFYLEYALLMGVYLYALADIVSACIALDRTPAGRIWLMAGLVALHSAALRFALSRGLGPEWEFVLEGGVAGQRLLGQVLQPSCFGVGLVLALALFLRGHSRWAAAAAAAAATVHPTYLLSAGLLVGAFLLMEARSPGGWKRAAGTAAVALVAVTPITSYSAWTFLPSGADAYAIASDILIRLRIPHHAIPAKWLDLTVAAQALVVVLALVRVRRTPLFTILAWMAGAAVALTAVQIATGNATLALLFPWRITSILIPLASAVLVTALVQWTGARLPSRLRIGAAIAGLIVLGALGVYRFSVELRQQQEDPAASMMEFAAEHLAEGQVYLIPPKLQDFRLRTGAPIVVDSKAIPYRDVEVIEWFDRLRLARLIYRDRPEAAGCGHFGEAAQDYGATHAVIELELFPLVCLQFVPVYDDGAYAIFALH